MFSEMFFIFKVEQSTTNDINILLLLSITILSKISLSCKLNQSWIKFPNYYVIVFQNNEKNWNAS